MRVAAVVALSALAIAAAEAAPRSKASRAEFQRTTPCPANGAKRGACPGHVVDHITPLCAGGDDRPHNMQWQTAHDAKLKDRQERLQCRRR